MAKQIVIMSGKGGTGKTVISGAFSRIADNKVIVDADVDAANLFLLLDPTNKEENQFSGGYKAAIDLERCVKCGLCRKHCRFDAITENFVIDDILCEGCGLCGRLCPYGVIDIAPADSGMWYVAETKYGDFVHAKLGAAEENSGKLVSIIKERAIEIARKKNCDWVLIDGPPGIGCPAIATLSGADFMVIVTEPTLSGLHDAKRVVDLAVHFNLPVKFIINKYDLSELIVKQIEDYCRSMSIEIIAKIAYNEEIVHAVADGKTIMDIPGFEQKDVLLDAWDRIQDFFTIKLRS